ncbi:hypothetical protein ACYJ1Y_09845 [Natrialbaceae archaeon A-gly3]
MNIASLSMAAWYAMSYLLQWRYHGDGSVASFPGPGTWVIFGVVLMPIYVMILAWFLGKPSNPKTAVMGVVYLVGIATILWVGMLIQTLLIGVTFF